MATTDSSLAVVSAEAGVGVRMVALLLDAGIAVVVFATLNLVLNKIGVLPALEVSQPSPLLEIWQHQEPWIALLATFCALVVVAWSSIAGTPGALLMGVNVVRACDGRRAGVVRCAWRLLISLALVGLGFLGARRGQRALHDRVSGTRLVREDEATHSLAHYAGRWR